MHKALLALLFAAVVATAGCSSETGTGGTDTTTTDPTGTSTTTSRSTTTSTTSTTEPTSTSTSQSTTGTTTTTTTTTTTGGPTAIFFDGAEGDASLWTITSNVFINDGTAGQEEVPAEHPSGMWSINGDNVHAGAGAYWSGYPDLYRSRMVSGAITVPDGGATFSYWLFGGAEDIANEGLFVLVGPDGGEREIVSEHRNVMGDWAKFSFPLAAGSHVVEFRFDSDTSCSNDSDAPPGFSCGEGYEGGGFWVDDITVE